MRAPLARSLRLAAPCLLALAAATAFAYTFDGIAHQTVGWDPAQPVVYHFNQDTSGALPNIAEGSDPRSAVDAAFAEWGTATGLNFMRGTDTTAANGGAAADGANIITFADTASNRAVVGGFTAVTVFWLNGDFHLSESDIIFNPTMSFTTLDHGGFFHIRPVATHEIGHFVGMEHSAVISATMYPYFDKVDGSSGSDNLSSRLKRDDLLGAATLYPGTAHPLPDTLITGVVHTRGTLIYGAQVVAVEAATGVIAGANITLGDNQDTALQGVFAIHGLPPGGYYLYAEPVDGVLDSGNWTGRYERGDYWGGEFDGDYQLTWYGGNASPTRIELTEGQPVTALIEVTSAPQTLIPALAGYSDDGTSFTAVVGLPVVLRPGESRNLVVLGLGLDRVPDGGIHTSDPAIAIDTSQRVDGDIQGYPWIIFRVSVPENSIGGARDLVFDDGTQQGTYTGGLYIMTDNAQDNTAGPEWIRYR